MCQICDGTISADVTELFLLNCHTICEIPVYPALTNLQAYNCSNLSRIPTQPSMTCLRIGNCPVHEIAAQPLLEEIYIADSPVLQEIAVHPTLKRLSINDCPTLCKICDGTVSADVTELFLLMLQNYFY